jgi:pSer/pThr/pTyr-binding forkhead associated (FHA) protein
MNGYSTLEIISKKDRGKQFVIDRPNFVIGRSSGCDLKLNEDIISGRHAVIVNEGTHIQIYDDDSKNGTFINSERLTHTHRLKKGDQITIGSVHFVFIPKQADSKKAVTKPIQTQPFIRKSIILLISFALILMICCSYVVFSKDILTSGLLSYIPHSLLLFNKSDDPKDEDKQIVFNHLLLKGETHFERKEYAKAQATFEQVIKSAPFNEFAHFRLGLIYFEQKQPIKSYQQFLKVITINPNHTKAIYNLGVLHTSKGRLYNVDMATFFFNRFLQIAPDFDSEGKINKWLTQQQ